MFERFLALRYLRGTTGPRGERFLRVVLYIAIGGVALGVAALVIALAIVRGFRGEIERKIVGFGAHVQVEALDGAPMAAGQVDVAAIEAMPGVERVAPAAMRFVLLRRSAEQTEGASLWGVSAPPPYLATQMRRTGGGRFSFAPDTAGRPGVVVGAALARRLAVSPGDGLVAITLPGGLAGTPEGAASEPVPAAPAFGLLVPPTPDPAEAAPASSRFKALHVAGVYETSLADFDDLFVFADLETTRDLLDLAPGTVTRYDITLDDATRAPAFAQALQERFGPSVLVRSIQDLYANLFAWVRLQQSIVPVVISVIVIVAAFNIIGVLLMFGLEKASDLGILASMGASPRRLRRLFLRLGLVVGAVGTTIGTVLALAVAYLQHRFQFIPLPAEAYFLDRVPIDVSAVDLVVVAAVTLALCALAAWLPARIASRTDPVRVLRFR